MEQNKIDYVVHDEAPYPGANGEADLYGFLKKDGKFIAS